MLLGGVALPAQDRALLRHRNGAFDPVSPRRNADPDLPVAPDSRLRFVQWRAERAREFASALRAAGAEDLGYFPDHGRLVAVDARAAAALAADPRVRAIIPLLASDKIETSVLATARAAPFPQAASQYLVRYRRARGEGAGARLIAALARPDVTLPYGDARRGAYGVLAVPPTALPAVLRSDDVLWLEPFAPPAPDMDVVRQVFGAVATAAPPFAYAGAGVAGEVLDFGPRLTHVDLAGTIVRGPAAPVPTLHGSATTAIAFGRGVGDPTAAGMLPAGVAISGYALDPGVSADRYAATAPLVAPPYEAVFQSNSWGGLPSLVYGAAAAALDAIVFDLDLLITQSQGNFGGPWSRPEAWAKNVVSVGGVHHFGTADLSDDLWGGLASIGPAADGRRKPDVVGFVDAVRTASDLSDTAYAPSFGGTSAAAPAVAGAAGLLAALYAEGALGPRPFGPSIFRRRPRAATLKALLLDSAVTYPFVGPGSALSRAVQGAGVPDVSRTLAVVGRTDVIDESVALVPGGVFERTFAVAAGEPEFRATLVWTDPPALPFASTALVNDFDLEVVAPDGTIYRGNFGSDQGPWSAPYGGADRVDTTESVRLAAPPPGTWTVRVTAFALNADGRPATAALDGVFALVTTGGIRLGGPADLGESSDLDAWLVVGRAANLGGEAPARLVPGPFFADFAGGGALEFGVGGAPGAPFVLAAGPLGRRNAVFPGSGSLDLGLLGAGDLSDLVVVWNGVAPVSPGDALAFTGPDGAAYFTVVLPPSPPGPFVAVQAAILAPGTAIPALTAAYELRIL
jgi:hypothetical protein